MIGLDVRDDRDFGMQLMERAVVLVGFDDEELALARLRVRTDVPEHSADDHGRIETGLFEDSGDHRGRRGLAVRAGDADGALAVDELAEHLRPADHTNPPLVRRIDLGVLPFDGGGDDDGVDAVQVGRVVADGDTDAAAHEEIGGRGGAEIASGYRYSRVLEDFGDATHPDSADADEMDVFYVTKMHSDVASLIEYFKFLNRPKQLICLNTFD